MQTLSAKKNKILAKNLHLLTWAMSEQVSNCSKSLDIYP